MRILCEAEYFRDVLGIVEPHEKTIREREFSFFFGLAGAPFGINIEVADFWLYSKMQMPLGKLNRYVDVLAKQAQDGFLVSAIDMLLAASRLVGAEGIPCHMNRAIAFYRQDHLLIPLLRLAAGLAEAEKSA